MSYGELRRAKLRRVELREAYIRRARRVKLRGLS